MRASARLLLALTAAFATTGAGALSLAPIAQAAACGATTGVTVVVDYGNAGANSIGCATGDPSTGLAALTTAGHSYVFVPRQPGFVCTIDATPDPCNNAPVSAYWSYWHAQPGGSWSYSTLGAGSYDPAPGSVEGWSFGSGNPPTSSPPAAVSAPKPASSPNQTGSAPAGGVTVKTPRRSGAPASPASPASPAPGVRAGGSKATHSPAGAPSTRVPTLSSTATAADTATTTGAPVTSGTTTALRAQIPVSNTAGGETDGLGGLGGVALGVGLVVMLGSLTGYLARRRPTGRG